MRQWDGRSWISAYRLDLLSYRSAHWLLFGSFPRGNQKQFTQAMMLEGLLRAEGCTPFEYLFTINENDIHQNHGKLLRITADVINFQLDARKVEEFMAFRADRREQAMLLMRLQQKELTARLTLVPDAIFKDAFPFSAAVRLDRGIHEGGEVMEQAMLKYKDPARMLIHGVPDALHALPALTAVWNNLNMGITEAEVAELQKGVRA